MFNKNAPKRQFAGNAMFSSVSTLQGHQPAAYDDLEAMVYAIIVTTCH